MGIDMPRDLPPAPPIEVRMLNAEAFSLKKGLARRRNPPRWTVLADESIRRAIISGFLIYETETDTIQLTTEGQIKNQRTKKSGVE